MPFNGNVKLAGTLLAEFVGVALFSLIRRKAAANCVPFLFKRWADENAPNVYKKNRRLETVEIWIKCVPERCELVRSGALARCRHSGGPGPRFFRAKRAADARRKEKSDLWLRRQEDARLAKRMAYRAKNALGMAPPLSTDTPVQRRLRSLHALARRQVSIRARFFGLLIDEYVRVGIPLPGLGLLHPGSNEIWTSEDLRGWIRNRQTIRFKKLTPEEAQPAERALCAWRQLERSSKNEDDPGNEAVETGAPSDSSTQPKASDTTWLADVHPKQLVTESMVPLAQPYGPPLPKKKHRRAAEEEEEDVVEDVPVAMFLVEFSLDPKRTVWINHSL